ncbi:hypothetical protein G9464_06125 [Halostella sp. JP-L12]|uniref:hypothetical protein n=1 Tax=Halostella TaxID=1843185 RepID=UPI000EF7FBBA|nr:MULTISPECIES: hypothetical protein [Halostella]NHN47176.1 hypothetical protein [Halostella sp. JP-L12]
MRRRRLLGALTAGVGAFGGCLDRARSDPGTATDDETSTDGTTDDDGAYAGVTVERAEATPEYVASNSPDSIGTYGERDEQYVIASVTADGTPAPPRAAFRLRIGDRSIPPTTEVGGMGERLWDYGDPYDSENGEGWVAFEVAKPLDAEGARLTWPGGGHELDEGAVERLSRPPTTFEVRGFDAPESMALDETVTAELTVANVGDADGTFVAAVNRTGPSIAYTPEARISLDVPAGETTTWVYESGPDDRYADPSDGSEGLQMIVRLRWRDGSLSREIAVETE